jgi:hypothetical protein
MYDDANDIAVTVTLWTTDDEADRAAADLRPLAVSAFADVLMEPPTIAKYDLLLAELEDR